MKDNSKADVSHTDEFDKMYQEMVKQAEDDYKVKSEYPETEEEVGLVDKFSSRWVNEFNLPNGYIFKDENGNVINATKIVLEKKKKEYPKTYAECCELLSLSEDGRLYTKGYKASLIQNFQQLLICRDAYWKIAGDEMGLGKPWEYDCKSDYFAFAIIYRNGWIQKVGIQHKKAILAFPTAEMRDAFYENFKELIEICKELL